MHIAFVLNRTKLKTLVHTLGVWRCNPFVSDVIKAKACSAYVESLYGYLN